MARTATAARSATGHDVAELATRVSTIITELSTEYFERYVAVEALMTALLAKENSFLLGPPGTGKSALCRAICKRVTGAEFFTVLLDRQLGKEEVFGAFDIAKYDQTGVFERNTEGMLPTAHVAFVDEVGKAGPSTLNPLLTAFNERVFKNGKHELPIPLLSVIGASNEYLEPELAAMWDRFLVRLDVGYIQEPGNFIALLASAVGTGTITLPTSLALDELQFIIDDVIPAIKVPSDIFSTMHGLRMQLAEIGVTYISDRRWKQCVRLLQAQAFIHGRDSVDEDDLAILRHSLWDIEEHRAGVQQKVLQLTGPIARKAYEILDLIEQWNRELDNRKGSSQADRSAYAAEVNKKVSDVVTETKDAIAEAQAAGRDVSKLDPVRSALKEVRTRVFAEFLNMPPDTALKIAEKDLF